MEATTGSTHSEEPLMEETLSQRYQQVSDLTQHYYQGDIIPPTTKSQVLRAQKFSVIYYYTMNAIFFLYAFLIPAIAEGPYYGFLDLKLNKTWITKGVIIATVVLIIMVRFLVLSWSAEFFQFAVLLAGLQVALCIFTAVFWSPGLPMLLTLLFTNLLNISTSQFYWKFQFAKVVKDLPSFVPPRHNVKDTTVFSVFSLKTMYFEFSKLWGFKKTKTPAMLYDERCGVFSTKDTTSHVEALHAAYMQALEPDCRWVSWRHSPSDLWRLNILGLLDGLLGTFVTNAAVSFGGLWFGKVMFHSFDHGWYAIGCAALIVGIYFASIRRILGWLEEALGVAVVEKEWLAHDVVKHTAQREEMLFDTVDVMGTSTSGGSSKTVSSPEIMQKGRLNMVFMWCCVAAVADFIGESYLAKLYWNLAHESRSMMEALTPYDFQLFPHAKWELTYKGTIIKSLQTLILAFTSCLFFGTYFMDAPVPVPLVAVIGAACFVQSVVKLTEALQYAFTILGTGKRPTHRHMYVSEWIVFISLIFVLVNILVWLYLLPIMKHWDLPVGTCKESLNQKIFPSACQGWF